MSSIFLIRYIDESVFGGPNVEVIEKGRNLNDTDATIILEKAKAYIRESFEQDKQYFTFDNDKGLWKLKIGNRGVSVDASNKVVTIWMISFEFDENLEILRSEYDWMLQEKQNDLPGASLKL